MHRSKEIRLKQAYFRYSIIRHVWACYDRIMMKLLSVAYITRIYYSNIWYNIYRWNLSTIQEPKVQEIFDI